MEVHRLFSDMRRSFFESPPPPKRNIDLELECFLLAPPPPPSDTSGCFSVLDRPKVSFIFVDLPSAVSAGLSEAGGAEDFFPLSHEVATFSRASNCLRTLPLEKDKEKRRKRREDDGNTTEWKQEGGEKNKKEEEEEENKNEKAHFRMERRRGRVASSNFTASTASLGKELQT